MYDFVGDIHGHADKLEGLLRKMGYRHERGSYRHPERKAFFVGDFIDRGPKIKETLHIVREMVDSGNALAVMGNHEYNAICFATSDGNGGYLRNHGLKNIRQHLATIAQLGDKEYHAWMDWFKTLPLFYEGKDFRVVHATWDYDTIAYLRTRLRENCLTDELIYESAQSENRLFREVEIALKGKEAALPEGISFLDKGGHRRHRIRIKWWENPEVTNLRNISILELPQIPEVRIDPTTVGRSYSPDDKPVFFGHYWMRGEPSLFQSNICCTDYSVAKDGYLVAYRWEDGQHRLSEGGFVWV